MAKNLNGKSIAGFDIPTGAELVKVTVRCGQKSRAIRVNEDGTARMTDANKRRANRKLGITADGGNDTFDVPVSEVSAVLDSARELADQLANS